MINQRVLKNTSNHTQAPTLLDDIPLPKKLPPLVLIAFTRPELLRQVLIGIAQQSILPENIIAFIDGARHSNDVPLIEKCISLLENFSSTVSVKIVARTKNLGCDQNTILSFTDVLSEHDALIHLEDDVVPNRFFYDRMCRLLEAYRNYSEIFSVSAYANLPAECDEMIDRDFIVSNRVFGLGFGIWADRWQQIDLANKPDQYNPFGNFYRIPITIQTKSTMLNQFWLEKNYQTDWVITLTLAALYQNKLHVIPRKSFVKNIGFGHPQAKTYKCPEPAWVNARYDGATFPNHLPSTLELADLLASRLNGTELAEYLSQQQGLWIPPSALLYFLRQYKGLESKISFLQLFMSRLPIMIRRWRSQLYI
jgi:hypothetical protein